MAGQSRKVESVDVQVGQTSSTVLLARGKGHPMDNRIRIYTGRSQGRERQIIRSLRKPATGTVSDQRYVTPTRRGEGERLLQDLLTRGRREQVVSAEHLGHGLLRVIHDHRELVSRLSIATRDREVSDLSRDILLTRTRESVLE